MAETGYVRPTLREIVARIAGDLNTRLEGLDAYVRRSKAHVIARAVAGVAHTVYGYGAAIAREILVTTASEAGLPKHGEIWSTPRREAQAASGPWTFEGTEASEIPAGTSFVLATGLEWQTDAAATVGEAGSVDVVCTAQEAGAAGNVAAGAAGSLTSPIAGVSSSVTAAEDIDSGLDAEDVEAWRARIIARIRNPPQGGAATDYERWALEVAGVDRVWVSGNALGPSTVVVRFTVPGEGVAAIPDAEKVAEVQAYIDALAPVTADVTVAAPVAYAVDFTIAAYPDDDDVHDAIRAELEALFRESADPNGGVIRHSHLGEAISRADGEEYHTLTTPAGDVQAPVGQLPIVGDITWS